MEIILSPCDRLSLPFYTFLKKSHYVWVRSNVSVHPRYTSEATEWISTQYGIGGRQ